MNEREVSIRAERDCLVGTIYRFFVLSEKMVDNSEIYPSKDILGLQVQNSLETYY
jgi:hypothetical protein